SSDSGEAVGAAREGIGLPVVEVPPFQGLRQAPRRDLQDPPQSAERDRGDRLVFLRQERFRRRAADPSGQRRRLGRRRRPPGRKGLPPRVKEIEVEPIVPPREQTFLLPEPLPKKKNDLGDVSRLEFRESALLLLDRGPEEEGSGRSCGSPED